MSDPSLWCPSCGLEYRPGTQRCRDCRVALVTEEPVHLTQPDDAAAGGEALVEIGSWPKIQAQVLRRRLETASIPVMIEWSGSAGDRQGTVLVPPAEAEFATAVVNEIDVDDEVSDDSPHAYVTRIEEHMSAVAGLLDELRTRLDDLEADGKL